MLLLSFVYRRCCLKDVLYKDLLKIHPTATTRMVQSLLIISLSYGMAATKVN